jgi:hypothetical protein
MNIKPLVTMLIAGLLVASCGKPATSHKYSANATKSETETRFICRQGYDNVLQQRLPTTYAFTAGEKRAIIRWSTQYFTGSGWDPQTRCEEVSPRFQAAYENGSLNMITNGMMNNQPVICTTWQDGGSCVDLLITLRDTDNGSQLVRELGQILNGRATGPLVHNSDAPVYIEVDIEQFIRNAPVE